jgi:formylmethanofuran dehydrogenase subunit E-like metal-binding protein
MCRKQKNIEEYINKVEVLQYLNQTKVKYINCYEKNYEIITKGLIFNDKG